jgi:hypothetical protein
MSNENVELVRSFYRPASVRRFIDLLDEEVEFDFEAFRTREEARAAARLRTRPGA